VVVEIAGNVPQKWVKKSHCRSPWKESQNKSLNEKCLILWISEDAKKNLGVEKI